MTEVLEFWISGLFLGLVAGVSPGHLLTLVFSETLKYGKKEGIKVAVSPLITDLPIVLFTLFIVLNLIKYNFVIGVVSLLGACYLIWLGIENVRIRISDLEVELARRNALKRGVIANFLNPQPYLFWLTIGSSTMIKSVNVNIFCDGSFCLWVLQFAYRIKSIHRFRCGESQVIS